MLLSLTQSPKSTQKQPEAFPVLLLCSWGQTTPKYPQILHLSVPTALQRRGRGWNVCGGRISNPAVTCRCHWVCLVLGPSPSVAAGGSEAILELSPELPSPSLLESSTTPDGFPAPTEGPALSWLWHTVLGAGCETRGWTGSTAPCWNPAGIGNCSPGCTGNTWIHQQLPHPQNGLLHSVPWDTASPCSASLQDLQKGRETLGNLSPSQNAVLSILMTQSQVKYHQDIGGYSQHNGICNSHALMDTWHHRARTFLFPNIPHELTPISHWHCFPAGNIPVLALPSQPGVGIC